MKMSFETVMDLTGVAMDEDTLEKNTSGTIILEHDPDDDDTCAVEKIRVGAARLRMVGAYVGRRMKLTVTLEPADEQTAD